MRLGSRPGRGLWSHRRRLDGRRTGRTGRGGAHPGRLAVELLVREVVAHVERNITSFAVLLLVVLASTGEADFLLAGLQFDDERLGRLLHLHPDALDALLRLALQHARDELLLLDFGAQLVVGARLQQVHADVGAHPSKGVAPVAADGAPEALQQPRVVLLEVLLRGGGRRQVRAAARTPPPARGQQAGHRRRGGRRRSGAAAAAALMGRAALLAWKHHLRTTQRKNVNFAQRKTDRNNKRVTIV